MSKIIGMLIGLMLAISIAMHLMEQDAHEALKIEFIKEFDQPVNNIQTLDPLARKNREFVIWEKIRDTASAIVTDEAVPRVAHLQGYDERDQQKMEELRLAGIRTEENKKRLVRQLGLAWRFGQFENANQTGTYGFLSRMITDDLLMNERKWYDVYKEIEEMKPEP